MSAIRPLRQSSASSSSSSSPPPASRSHHTRGSNSPPAEGTEEVFQTIVQNRKSWKTARGGETVWPPELEAALLEGLASYQPDDSRETRLLGRFPMRNRIISDYILQKTGKRRTAKQVGSRLQQLRDTCGGSQLLKLLSPVPRPSVPPPQNIDDEYYSDGNPSTSAVPVPRVVMSIDILPDGVPCPCSSPSCRFSNAIDGVQSLNMRDQPNPSSPKGFGQSSHPRPLRAIDPTITFTANSEVEANSLFTVFHDTTPVHTETVALQFGSPVSNEDTEGLVLFSTPLVPGYWNTICSSADPSRYSIQHEVEGIYNSTTIFSALYKFAYPPGMTWRGAPVHMLNDVQVPYSSLASSGSSSGYRSSSTSSSPALMHSFQDEYEFTSSSSQLVRGSHSPSYTSTNFTKDIDMLSSTSSPPQFEIDGFGYVFDTSPSAMQTSFSPDIHSAHQNAHHAAQHGGGRYNNPFYGYDSDTDSSTLSPMSAVFGNTQQSSPSGSSYSLM